MFDPDIHLAMSCFAAAEITEKFAVIFGAIRPVEFFIRQGIQKGYRLHIGEVKGCCLVAGCDGILGCISGQADRCKIDPDTEDTHPEEKKTGADEHSSGDIFRRRVSVVQRIIHAVHTVLYKIPFVIWIVVPAFSPVIVVINIKWCAVLGEDPLFFFTQPEKHDQYDGSRYQFEENVDSHSNSADPVAGCNIPDDPEIGAGIANVGEEKEYGV